jgi:hypothetical protein
MNSAIFLPLLLKAATFRKSDCFIAALEMVSLFYHKCHALVVNTKGEDRVHVKTVVKDLG